MMQIHRIHDDRHPFSPPNGPHTFLNSGVQGETGSVRESGNDAANSLQSTSAVEIQSLITRLHQLPDDQQEAVQQAKAQIESGALFSREAAELVAFSPLLDFVFSNRS